MSKKEAQKKSWFKGLKAEFTQDHLAGQRDTCKTDSGSRFCDPLYWERSLQSIDFLVQYGVDLLVR